MKIPWSIAELAYGVYATDYGGDGQSLERVAERGGFYCGEMDLFLPDWRERCDEINILKQKLKEALELVDEALLVVTDMKSFITELIGEGDGEGT